MIRSTYSFIVLCATLFISSCRGSDRKASTEDHMVVTDTAAAEGDSSGSSTVDVTDEEYATYYVLVADTGRDYYSLDKEMYRLSRVNKMTVDTMNRYYNEKRGKIILRENDPDELYAGAYFPRRFPGEELSLEYLDMFTESADTATIALIGGIYSEKTDAINNLAKLQTQKKSAYLLESRIYVGCMH